MRFSTTTGRMAKLAMAGAIALVAPLMQGATDLSTNFNDRVLAGHNREREALGIPALRWDNNLARDAAIWAQHLTEVGHLVHSPDEPLDPDPQGENLWAGTRGYYGADSMVGLWVAERKNFKQGIFPNNAINGDLEQVGHYTQLTWRSTKAVGCALAHGRRDDFLVCRYNEGGNVMGERPF
ncbi:CAP domain-containing protein [Sphingomonas crocodyli]|uniref:SCP-like extracellular n=1 Tax=Sphingomonas crocodyli TaxID=1979270 RepID=A0A437MB54_9SPHN|nr:CAP domain-containing protein [Sphingomonas crocodyli]RVT94858.1 SCP-like extracellular [Sphingomonas crocodyli]